MNSYEENATHISINESRTIQSNTHTSISDHFERQTDNPLSLSSLNFDNGTNDSTITPKNSLQDQELEITEICKQRESIELKACEEGNVFSDAPDHLAQRSGVPTQDTLDSDIIINTTNNGTIHEHEHVDSANLMANSMLQINELQFTQDFFRREPETKIHLAKISGFFFMMVVGSIYLFMVGNWHYDAYNLFTVGVCYLAYFAAIDIFWKVDVLKEIWLEGDDVYKLLDILSVFIFQITLSLRLVGLISMCSFYCAGFIISTTIYCIISKTPINDKIWEILTRCFYCIQALAIALKADGFIGCEWRIIFIPSWVYFGFLAFFFTRSIVDLSNRLQVDQSSSQVFKRTGLLWFIGSRSSILILFWLLLGFAEIRNSIADVRMLNIAVCVSLLINVPMLLWSLISRHNLIKFMIKFRLVHCLLTIYTVEGTNEVPSKQISFEAQNNKRSFLMISPTYFVLLNKTNTPKTKTITSKGEKANNPLADQNKVQGNELNLTSVSNQEKNYCYICCKNLSNVIFTGCGHGGICYDCAIAAVKQKDTCLQCRGNIDAIYVFDPERVSSIISSVQSYKIVKS